MAGIATKSLPELVTERRQTAIESLTLSGRNLESKLSTLFIWSSAKPPTSRIQISELASKLAIAVANLVIKSDSSSEITNSTSSNAASQSIANMPYLGISTPTSQSILGLTSPTCIISRDLPPYTPELSRRNSNTDLHISSKSGLNPVSIIVGALGSVALTSLVGIMLLLMRKRKRRRFITADSNSQRRGSLNYRAYETFWPKAHNQTQQNENTSRTRNLIRQLKCKLRGESANTLQFSNPRQRKVDLDRGNSQFSSDHYYRANYSASNHNMKTSPENHGNRWPTWNDEEIDHLVLSDKNSKNPTVLKTGMVEKQLDQSEFYQLLSVKVEKYEGSSELKSKTTGDRRNSSLKSSSFNNSHLHSSSLATLDYGEQSLDDFARVNPVDFITRPGMTVLKANDRMDDVGPKFFQSRERQNRSSQFPYDHYLRNNTPIEFRSPSIIAPTLDSNRDSIYSSISTPNEYHDKRRSDPFDLDTPDLWRARIR